MSGLQGAVETAPVSRLHEKQSYDPADFGVPIGARGGVAVHSAASSSRSAL